MLIEQRLDSFNVALPHRIEQPKVGALDRH